MSSTSQQRFQKRRSFLWQVTWCVLGVAIVAVCTLSVAAFIIANAHTEHAILAQLSDSVATKENLLEARLQQDRERAALLSSWDAVRRSAMDAKKSEAIESLFVQLLDEGVPVAGITVFNAARNPVMGIGVPVELLPKTMAPTLLIPVVGEKGWSGHIAYAQIQDDNGMVLGTLAIRYDVGALLQNILSVSSLGDTAEVLLGRENGQNLILLHHRYAEEVGGLLFLGSLQEEYDQSEFLAKAVRREEGMGRTEDYEGADVFAAYRYLPTFGWGLVVKMDVREAMAGVLALRATLATVGLVIILLAALLSVILARHVTEPVRTLSTRMAKLQPGYWQYRRSVHTGDELEVLDNVAADLAKRLDIFSKDLEGQVRQRTKELSMQFQKDRAILQSIQHGIVAVDAKGVITDINKSAADMIGEKEADVVGKPINSVLRLTQHGKFISTSSHPVLRCLTQKKAVPTEPGIRWSLYRVSGQLIPITISVSPVLARKKVLGGIAVFYDTTDERRVDYIKSEFISLASHQLRTPLSSLQWYIELFGSAGEPKLSSVQKEYLQEMDTASKRMAKLVDALLHAARLEGNNISPANQKINLTEFVQDISEELRSLAKVSKISCEVQIPKRPYMVNTDPILLHIVFQNLFSNAVKYGIEGGQVKVSMNVKNREYEIHIEDNGIGIPKKSQPRIFERLFRAENVLLTDTDGSGLGLYISRMLMENLHGSIRFKSTEKKGSIFTITLPKTVRKTPKKKSSESSQ
ncbi:hypothetical protein COU78_06210 [Candidatus Peregrinibacteria bacterium CG10_big_fil_rev_8_21_14_0_10_49_24]|nr:MAG: hypothetical protein COU78_06210 [Candidatus Peregrinibacteria bacterium CG10_big_fil_rev_8_21_14_0_10_49_24]